MMMIRVAFNAHTSWYAANEFLLISSRWNQCSNVLWKINRM